METGVGRSTALRTHVSDTEMHVRTRSSEAEGGVSKEDTETCRIMRRLWVEPRLQRAEKTSCYSVTKIKG